MKMVESADGTIQVVELDPTKKYWIILEAGGLVTGRNVGRGADGLILTKRKGESISVIENAGQIVGVLKGAAGSRELQVVREAANRAVYETVEGV